MMNEAPHEIELVIEALTVEHGADFVTRLQELTMQFFIHVQTMEYQTAVEIASRLSICSFEYPSANALLMNEFIVACESFEGFEFDPTQEYMLDSYGAMLNEAETEHMESEMPLEEMEDEMNEYGAIVDGDE